MSFWRTYYHLVWATKARQPLITPEIEAFLIEHFLRKAAELDVQVYAINGWADHIHLIVAIPPSLAVSEVVKNLKGSSSHDINAYNKTPTPFAWQRGYGVFSLGERQRGIAEAYVHNQKNHHREQTVNTWLERCEDKDDGPAKLLIQAAYRPVETVLREPAMAYSSIRPDEIPF